MAGIPHMGSKRKIAPQLLRHMTATNPQAQHFVDLFGGGGAMSFAALQRDAFESVHHNELSPAVVALLRKIRADGVTGEFYQWISRERFHELKDGSDWLVGLVQSCWSFGDNATKGHLYGAGIEAVKRQWHARIATIASEQGWQAARGIVVAQAGPESIERLERIQHLERIGHLDLVRIWHM